MLLFIIRGFNYKRLWIRSSLWRRIIFFLLIMIVVAAVTAVVLQA
jgi:hypothetical protein